MFNFHRKRNYQAQSLGGKAFYVGWRFYHEIMPGFNFRVDISVLNDNKLKIRFSEYLGVEDENGRRLLI